MEIDLKLDSTYLIKDSEAPDFGDAHVQVAKFQPMSYVAGPGCRCVVWVAGCRRRCPGCFQSQFFDFAAGELTAVEALANRILEVEGIEGVTFSGGEPFEQSAALSRVCEIVKRESNLTTLAYTGYRAEALASDLPKHGAFLNSLDILIDGAYEQHLAGRYLWRGSSNQKVRMRDVGDEQADLELPLLEGDVLNANAPEVQVAVDDETLVLTGFPDDDVDDALRRSLLKRGVILGPQQRSSKRGPTR
ncbi:anaerobic ribonucleoside-triphosphate reductase activating protein [Rhodopirellula europaea SH398]|uniref:Anaerobic ribonucleoside-triphosphate reductase activating protein n=1 Tax=Rhodopirellula europaea SH398 TaxID=1263868 RepID=M5RZ79_9BACT|nr:anaerobic ribonucleoside-triphosphate reductase activating protein [Rhodopirellula europaea SH398]